jgi:hypothetical protein
VLRVPASGAPPQLAPGQEGADTFTAVPVARQAAGEAVLVPHLSPVQRTFSSEGASTTSDGVPGPAVQASPDTARPPDTERLVAQLVGPLFERLRAELRRERMRRGSVHDRLG